MSKVFAAVCGVAAFYWMYTMTSVEFCVALFIILWANNIGQSEY